jgi:hypothetical protein
LEVGLFPVRSFPVPESRSAEELIADLKRQAAKLPPGSDVAGFITRGVQRISQQFAQDVADARAAALPQAEFPPPGVP